MEFEKIIYQEKYKKYGLSINREKLPRVRHLNPGFRCISASILSAGIILKDSKKIEYQDIRIYIDSV